MVRNMPRGVEVAPLGRRLLGWLIDLSVPTLLSGLLYWLPQRLEGAQLLVVAVVIGLLQLAWALMLWWGYATRGAGLGYQATGLQLVGLTDGKPIGWWRFFLRQLVFSAVMATVVGGVALLIFLVIQDRRQGWHDLAGKAVAISRRGAGVAKPAAAAARSQRPKGPSTTVALPPHLIAAAFDDSRAAGTQPAPPSVEQAWQANTYGGQGPQQETGWRPPSAPGDRGAGPGELGQGALGQGGQQPAHHAAPGPQWQSTGSGQAAFTASAASQSPARPPASPARQPEVPARWMPPQPAQATFETSVRPRPALADEDEYGGTRLVAGAAQPAARPATEGWFVRFDDGRMVPLDRQVLVGRNPVPASGVEATVVQVGENGQAISKTHLAIGVDQRGVHVTDRGSTNGTALVNAKGELEPCLPGIQARVRENQVVSFGDRSFTVLRKPADS